jgi:hypothetical protein
MIKLQKTITERFRHCFLSGICFMVGTVCPYPYIEFDIAEEKPSLMVMTWAWVA